MKKYIFLTLLSVVLAFSVSYAQQDTIVTKSGDMIIGEIKSLNKNILTFDTDYADKDFRIEWDKLENVVANTLLIIYTANGKKYKGYLRFSKKTQRIISFEESTADREVLMSDIVTITAIDKNFWSRIKFSIDAGFNFTKANNLSQLTTNNILKYRADKWEFDGSFNNVYTNQDDVDPTERNEGKTHFSYDIFGDAFAFVGIEFLKKQRTES